MKVKKVIGFFIILISIISISIISNASYLENFTGDATSEPATRAGDILSASLDIIQIVGVTVAIVMLMTLGIKYMVASAADRAEIKKHAIVYFVGAIIMFGAAGLVEIVKNFSTVIGS